MDRQRHADTRRVLLMLSLVLVLSSVFVLSGIFTAPVHNQLTLTSNATQSGGNNNVWTDIDFGQQALTTSVYWRYQPPGDLVSLSPGGPFDLYLAIHPTSETAVSVSTRLVRQRGSDPSFYQEGPIYTPVPQASGMMLTLMSGLQTEALDVYKLQWLSDQATLVPIAVDLGLIGVSGQGMQLISAYLVVAMPVTTTQAIPSPPSPPTGAPTTTTAAPTAVPTAAPTAASGIATINDIHPDPTSLNFLLIPGANVLFDQPVPNSLRINASAGRDGANGTCTEPCQNGTQGPQGNQGPAGRDASVTVSVLNLSNNTNVTETVYNATQFTVNITITENATFVSTNCSCLHTVNTIGPDAQLDFTLLGGSGIAVTPGTNALTISTTIRQGIETIGGVTADSNNDIGLIALSPLVLTNTSHAWQLSTTCVGTINSVTPDSGNNFALTAVGPLSVTGTSHGSQLSTTCVATIGGVTADSNNNIGLTVQSPLVLTNTSHAWQLSTTLTQGITTVNNVQPDSSNNINIVGVGPIVVVNTSQHTLQLSSTCIATINSVITADSGNNVALTAIGPLAVTNNAHGAQLSTTCVATIGGVTADSNNDIGLTVLSPLVLTNTSHAWQLSTTCVGTINSVTPDSSNNFALTATSPLIVTGTTHGAQLSTTAIASIGGVTADSSNDIGLTALSPLVLTNTSHAWQISTTLQQGIVAINDVSPDNNNNLFLTALAPLAITNISQHTLQLSTTCIATVNNVQPDNSNNFALTAVGPLAVTNTVHGAQLSTTCVATIGGVTADGNNDIGLTALSPLVLTNTSHAWQLSTTSIATINSVAPDSSNNFALTATGPLAVTGTTHGVQLSTTCVATIGGVTADSSNDIGLTVSSPLVLTNTSHAWQISTTCVGTINSVAPDSSNNFALTATGPLAVTGTTHGAQLSTTCVATIGGVTADSSNNIGLTVVSPLVLTNTSHAWQISTTLTQGITTINSVTADSSNNFALTGTAHVSVSAQTHGVQLSTDGTSSNTASTLVARDSTGSFVANQIQATLFQAVVGSVDQVVIETNSTGAPFSSWTVTASGNMFWSYVASSGYDLSLIHTPGVLQLGSPSGAGSLLVGGYISAGRSLVSLVNTVSGDLTATRLMLGSPQQTLGEPYAAVAQVMGQLTLANASASVTTTCGFNATVQVQASGGATDGTFIGASFYADMTSDTATVGTMEGARIYNRMMRGGSASLTALEVANVVATNVPGTQGLLSVSIASGGTGGCQVGNICTVGGTGTGGTVLITAVSGAHVATAIQVQTPGYSYTVASGVATSGGSCACTGGFTVNVLSVTGTTYSSVVGLDVTGYTAANTFATPTLPSTVVGIQVEDINLGGQATASVTAFTGQRPTTQVGTRIIAQTQATTTNRGIWINGFSAPLVTNEQIFLGGNTASNATNYGLFVTAAGAAAIGSTNTGVYVAGSSVASSTNVGVKIDAPSGLTGSVALQLTGQTTTANGGIQFGSGADSPRLANLYRSANGQLTTDGNFVASEFQVAASSFTGGTNVGVSVGAMTGTGGTNTGISISGITANSGNNVGIDIGVIQGTGTGFSVGLRIAPPVATTAYALQFDGQTTTPSGGIIFGTNADSPRLVTLYRAGNGILKTDAEMVMNHVIANGNTPTCTALAGIGTGGTCSVTGSDTAFLLTVNTGTSPPAATNMLRITYGNAFGGTNAYPVFSPASNIAGALPSTQQVSTFSFSTSSFLMFSGTSGLTASTTYIWTFHVIGY